MIPGLIGQLQALEVFKIATNRPKENILAQRMTVIDGSTGAMRNIKLRFRQKYLSNKNNFIYKKITSNQQKLRSLRWSNEYVRQRQSCFTSRSTKRTQMHQQRSLTGYDCATCKHTFFDAFQAAVEKVN